MEARKQYAEEIFEESKNRLLDQGEFGEAALKKAKEMTKKRMDSLAALHSPDLIAGGKDVVTSMGDRGVNSSIGRQWRERVKSLDDAAKKTLEKYGKEAKMNVKLKRCK